MSTKKQLEEAVYTPGETVMEFEERLRTKGVGKTGQMETRAEAAFRALEGRKRAAGAAADEAAQAGRAGMRMQAAQALRAAGNRPGGNIAALRQTGMQTGQALSEQETGSELARQKMMFGLEEKVGQAGVEAAAQGLESAKFEKEAGSRAEDRQMKIKEYSQQISKIKKDFKGGLGGMLPDDEEGAYQAILALAAGESDPQIKAFITSQANAARKDI